MRKPNTYGSPAIRVYHAGEYHWFSDAAEAMEFVKQVWTEGTDLSARVNDGAVWQPIYQIDRNGDVFVSPVYESVARKATVYLGNVTGMAR